MRLVVDGAHRIDTAARRVTLTAGDILHYDYLVYAVGSTGSVPASVPGAAEFAYPISELEQAHRLRERLADVPMQAPIVVVGGGLTGIETASEFAETGRHVTLVSGMVGPSLSKPGRRSVAKRLTKLGVAMVEGADATVSAVGPDQVVLADGRVLASAVTIWTAGFGVPDLAAASGLPTDAAGRLLTDETLTSVVLDGEEGDDTETFCKRHADDAHRQDVAECARIAADGFCSLRADHAHAERGAETGETADDAAGDASGGWSCVSGTFLGHGDDFSDHCDVCSVFVVFGTCAHAFAWSRRERDQWCSSPCSVVFGRGLDVNRRQKREDHRLQDADEKLHEIERKLEEDLEAGCSCHPWHAIVCRTASPA